MGPNWACCLACRRASSGDGGWKRVVGNSSMFGLSAVAVDRDIVGKDSDAELIGGEEGLGLAPVDWDAACVG